MLERVTMDDPQMQVMVAQHGGLPVVLNAIRTQIRSNDSSDHLHNAVALLGNLALNKAIRPQLLQLLKK